MSSIKNTEEARADENKIPFYHGCFVQLKNGDVLGPLIQRWLNNKEVCYVFQDFVWDQIGRVRSWHGADGAVACVLPEEHAGKPRIDMPDVVVAEAKRAVTNVSIPPKALRAAMDAGLRAKPAYEDFVKAIVTAAFAEIPIDAYQAVMEKEAEDQTTQIPLTVTLRDLIQVIDKALDPWERKHGRIVPPMPIAQAIFGLLKFKLNEAHGKHNSEIGLAIPENPKAEPAVKGWPSPTTTSGENLHFIPEWRLKNLLARDSITQAQYDREIARRQRP